MPKQYTIAFEGTVPDLIQAVNELMADGWTPTGGVWAGTTFGSKVAFFQALVK